jgi:mannose-1-phosphate guanylyltransferase
MEKTNSAVVIPLNVGWSDIGSWSSLWEISSKDKSGNSVTGDVMVHNSENCYVRSDNKLVALVGCNNMVIVDTKDALLVANKDTVQDTKLITKKLKIKERSECELHREVYRPWGKYDSIDNGAGYQVKRITVNPGAKLSLQKHKYRSEHWIVVSGIARVTKGDKIFLLKKNESTYIPLGEIHSLENPGEVNLELIEVQSGSYLGEDDIIRVKDIYGRAKISNQ